MDWSIVEWWLRRKEVIDDVIYLFLGVGNYGVYMFFYGEFEMDLDGEKCRSYLCVYVYVFG